MSNIIIPKGLDVEDKLALMREDAKFEVGVDSDAENTALLCAADVKGRPAPPKIPKMFLSSACIFNCAYCGCRCSREERQNYCYTPSEIGRAHV
jgi:predicted DNA-binding helix-hairpin-helix protein